MPISVINKMSELRYPAQGKVIRVIEELDKISAVVYTSDAPERFIALAYTRNALNPKFHYRFSTPERREAYVQDWIKTQVARETAKVAERNERNKGHTLKVGDVLNTSWGYDQTNVEYYQLVELKGKATAMFCEIAQVEHDDSHVLPAVDSFIGKPFLKRVNSKYNSVKISSCQTATPVSTDAHGKHKPSYKTPWGYGH